MEGEESTWAFTVAPGEKFPRPSLSLVDSIAMIIGIVIGAGIFETPALVAMQSASEFGVILLWTLGGLISLIGALCYAELATLLPSVGGTYVYIKEAFGPKVGFLYAWARMSVIQTGSIALLAFVFGDHAARIYSFGPSSNAVYAIGAVLLLTALHIRGVRQGKNIQTALSILQVTGMLLLIGLGLDASPASGAPAPAPSSGNAGLALVFVLLTFGGWNEAAYISAEIENREKNIPRSLIISIGIITLIYLLLNIALLKGIGLEGMVRSQTVVASFAQSLFGTRGLVLTSLLIALCAMTSISGTIFTGARSNFAVAQDFPVFSFMSGWQRSAPIRGYVTQALIATGLILFGSYSRNGFQAMIDFTAPVFWFFFLLSGVSLFIFRRRPTMRSAAFRVPFYPLTPLAFCAACTYLLYSSLVYTGWGAVVGVLFVASGGLLLLGNRRDPNTGLASLRSERN